MDDRLRTDEDRALSVRLEIHLDRRPISGRLCAERGEVEEFVGWLGFVDALARLHGDPRCSPDHHRISGSYQSGGGETHGG